MEEMIAKKFKMLAGTFNKRQRRLWAASEAMSVGRGGASMVARATGMSRTTIHCGIKELAGQVSAEERMPAQRVRRAGGGRKNTTVK